MDIDHFNDDDWGPWVAAKDILFKDGDIFVLGIYGPVINCERYIFMAMGDIDSGGNTLLHKYVCGVWDPNHSWNMSHESTVVRFPKRSNNVKILAFNKECPCGIYRGDCEYHK
jgi:hypothetical protein